jgi:hypothetical protein
VPEPPELPPSPEALAPDAADDAAPRESDALNPALTVG